MPKMKTHSGAKKRFTRTAKGKVKFKRAKMRHILEHKSKSMKRKARKSGYMCDSDAKLVAPLLPYA
jgi:large subunit ribosomal protein L35